MNKREETSKILIERKIKDWDDYLSYSREIAKYNITRYDLLVISICGAGIYCVFETSKFLLKEHNEIQCSQSLFWAGILFICSIVTNLISQLFGFKANNYEISYISQEKRKLNNDLYESDKKIEEYNLASIINGKITQRLNYICLSFLFFGIITLGVTFAKLLKIF